MAEFLGGCNGEEVDTCGGVSEIKNKFVGVSKSGNKWRARVRDPKLRADVDLGRFRTPEEAAVAVKKKRLEFEAMYKGESMNIRKGYFKGMKLPVGVRRDNGKWRVQLWHPKLKHLAQLGLYKTCEEAAIVAEMKRAEFQDLQEPTCEGVGIVADEKRADFGESNKPVTDVARKSSDQTGVVKMPPGVKRTPSGKWVARIRDPMAKTQIWLGTFNTVDEALRAYNEKKVLLAAAKMTRARFDGSEFENTDKPRSKPEETSVKLERELEYNSPASSLVPECLNNVAPDEQSSHGHGKVHSSPTSVFYARNSNSSSVSDKTHALDFNREASLSVVNEYGQLLDEFRELDEQMWFNVPN